MIEDIIPIFEKTAKAEEGSEYALKIICTNFDKSMVVYSDSDQFLVKGTYDEASGIWIAPVAKG